MQKTRWWIKAVFVAVTTTLWAPIVFVICAECLLFWLDSYGSRVLQEHENELYGKSTTAMVKILGKPCRKRHEEPKIIETATNHVAEQFQAYDVWYYSPWPQSLACDSGLKIFVRNEIVIGFKHPLD